VLSRALEGTIATMAVAGRDRPTAPLPRLFRAQLATLVKTPPAGDEWLHEMKFDGYRIGARLDAGDVRLLSRNGKDWTTNFPEVRNAVARLPARRAFLDGEVAVVLPDGRTSFQALQNAGDATRAGRLVYFVFDLLHLDGEDVAALPLEERKARLAEIVNAAKQANLIRYSEHVTGGGAAFFEQACRHGLEGIISKRRALPYQPGRHAGWLKTKCVQRQELVIGGFTDPEGSRVGLGALLVGAHDADRRLVFAGKVGTGFTHKTALDLRRRLEAIERPMSPFTPRPAGWLGRNAHWVDPRLVAEVAFTEWTDDGKIRHPSFQGLRLDKRARDVVREVPAPTAATVGDAPAPRGTSSAKRMRVAAPAAIRATRGKERVEVAGVSLSNPDRVLYPDVGITKLELARFYEEIADWIAPHVAGRPLTLVRCPKGIGESCFYMKHSKLWAPGALRQIRIREKTKVGEYLIADDVAGIVALVQMDVLELHTWNSKEDRVDQPDRVVFDLDPGPEVPWPRVIETARLVRAVLQTLGLVSFVKTTGGVGLHIVVPLVPERDWTECLAFSRALAEALERRDPKAYTTAFPKLGREHKILIDYLRNNRTNTSVAAFSTRARPGAPVSVTLAWEELSARVRPNHYTVRNLRKRLASLRADPWKDYWTTRQRIPDTAIEALARI